MGLFNSARWRLAEWLAPKSYGPANPSALASSLIGPYQYQGAPRSGAAILKFYRESPLLHMVGDKISTMVSAVPWKLFRVAAGQDTPKVMRELKSGSLDDRKWRQKVLTSKYGLEEISEHPLLSLLNNGNSAMLGRQCRKLMQLYMDLVGESFMLLQFGKDGVPDSWYPVNPVDVEQLPKPGREVYKIRTDVGCIELPKELIFCVRNPDPDDPYGRGLGPAAVVGDELETHEYATRYTKTFFQSGGQPRVIITSPNVTKRQALRSQISWAEENGVYSSRDLLKILQLPDQAEIHELKSPFNDAPVTQLREHEAEFVLQVYGISPEVFGLLRNANRATAEVAMKMTMETVVIPRLEVWREAFQELLVPLYGGGIMVDYIDPRPEDRQVRMRISTKFPWAMSIDEARVQLGYEPLEGGAGDMYAIPSNIVFVKDHSEVEYVPPPPPSDPNEEEEEGEEEGDGDSEGEGDSEEESQEDPKGGKD